MRRFLHIIWRVITFPFRAVWWIITSPVRGFNAVKRFMLTEPEEHPLGDVFLDLTQNEQARQLFWDQIEALRSHLLRAILGIIVGVGISFTFTEKIVQFLAIPVGGLKALKAIEVTESIGVFMNVALLSGLAISLPYVAFEFWFFAAPGLKPL